MRSRTQPGEGEEKHIPYVMDNVCSGERGAGLGRVGMRGEQERGCGGLGPPEEPGWLCYDA